MITVLRNIGRTQSIIFSSISLLLKVNISFNYLYIFLWFKSKEIIPSNQMYYKKSYFILYFLRGKQRRFVQIASPSCFYSLGRQGIITAKTQFILWSGPEFICSFTIYESELFTPPVANWHFLHLWILHEWFSFALTELKIS